MKRARDDAGITLVEVVVASALLAALLGIVFGAFSSALDRVTELDGKITVVSDARLVVDRFARDVRQAYTGDADVPVVVEMTTTRLTFYAGDRSTPLRLRKVTYELTAGTLTKAETLSSDSNPPTGPPGAAVDQLAGITNPVVFQYLEADGDVATVPTAVVTVRLSIDLAPGAGTDTPQQFQVAVDVRANR